KKNPNPKSLYTLFFSSPTMQPPPPPLSLFGEPLSPRLLSSSLIHPLSLSSISPANMNQPAAETSKSATSSSNRKWPAAAPARCSRRHRPQPPLSLPFVLPSLLFSFSGDTTGNTSRSGQQLQPAGATGSR
ncbi:hypothetical protein AABB24_032751, partial [Solanum stoloniferum]